MSTGFDGDALSSRFDTAERTVKSSSSIVLSIVGSVSTVRRIAMSRGEEEEVCLCSLSIRSVCDDDSSCTHAEATSSVTPNCRTI